MKRILTTIFISTTLSLSVSAQTSHLDIRESDRTSARLIGMVKSVETEVCKNVSDERTKTRTEYDESGNAVVTLNWNSDGELTNTSTNFYDEHGCYYRRYYIGLEKKGVTNDWEVILNPETRQIAMKNDRTGSFSIRTYSPEKRLLHYRFMDKEKKLKSASRNKWNTAGQRSEFVKLDEKNRPLYTYWFKWKENGFIDKERQRYHQEKKERLHDYEYLAVDERGNWTQQLLIRYDIAKKEKKKVYEKTTVRTIEYFEDE